MKRLEEIFSWLMGFITDKKNCSVTLEIKFENGNIRTCKTNEGKNFDFKE